MSTSDLLLDPTQQNPAFTLPEQWSDSSDDSDVETPKTDDAPQQEQPPQQVEWLATSRAKRSTAGNRMKSMLANEEPAAEDSDLELLFAEDEDDAGFTDDDKEDASDVQMDSSSDDEDDKDGANVDDLEGEKELERQAREKKAAQRKRKAQEAIPMKFRKKVRIEQPPSATGDSAAGSPAPSTTGGTPAASSVRQGPAPRPPRPKKKSERISWLPTPADMPTRASERRTTKMSKEQLHQKMIEDEIRRKKLLEKMEKAAKRAEAMKKPPMTQAERLAEAALVEKRNEKSLNRWEEAEKVREEERLRKIAALNNRKLDGPVVTFWSGIQTLEEGQQKHVGKMVSMEEKPVRRKRQSVSATLAAQEAAEKEKAKAEEAAKQTPSTEKADVPMTDAANKEVPKEETPVEKACSLAAVPEKPKEPISTPDVVMKDAPEPQQQTQPPQPSQPPPKPLTLAPLRGPMAPPPIPPPPPVETKVTHSSGVLAAPVLAPPAGVAPPMLDAQMPGLAFPFSNGMSNVLAPPNTTSPLSMPASSGGLSAPTPAPAPAPPVMSAPVTPAPTTNLTFAPAHIPAPTLPRDASSPAATLITTTIQTKQAPTPPPSSQAAVVSPEKPNTENKSASVPKDDKSAKDGKGEEISKEKKAEDAEKRPDGPQEGPTVQTGQPAADGEEEKTVNKVTRSCIILQNFDEAAIKDKQVQTQIIFGRRMEKLAKPAHPPICVVTGHPARYRDPKTGLPYYNAYAYREIQRVHRGDYKFSALLGAYVGSQTYAAKGVPERFLNPNGKRSTPKEDPAMIAKRKEAEEAEKKKKEEEKQASEKKTKETGAGDLDKRLDDVQATALPPLREPKLALHLPRRASGTDVPKVRAKSKDTTTPHDHLKRKSSTSSLPAKMTGPVVQAKLEPIEGLVLPPAKAASVPAPTPALSSTSQPTPSAPATAVPRKTSPLQLSTPPLQTQAQFKLMDDAQIQQRLQAPAGGSTSSSAQSTPQTSKAPSPSAEVPIPVPAPIQNSAAVSVPASVPASAPSAAPAATPAPVPAQAQTPTKPVEQTEPTRSAAETPRPPAPAPAPVSAPVAEARFQFTPAPGSDKSS